MGRSIQLNWRVDELNPSMAPLNSTRRIVRGLLLALTPVTVGVFALALRFPDMTESLYSQATYPWVARGFALVNRAPFSLAETVIVLGFIGGVVCMIRIIRRSNRRLGRTLVWLVGSGAVTLALFFVLWGFNYARPSLAARAGLAAGDMEAESVLAAGISAAELASSLYESLETQPAPSVMPFDLGGLNRALDTSFNQLKLPGDPIDFAPTPAKPLASSVLLSYLGISGIFFPFTGEPSINILQPDAALPLVVAHEKAHQRGVTNEGEANFAAFIACADEASPPYLRYAAYLFATRYLLGEASRYLPRETIDEAWSHLDEGPTTDVRAIYDFWRRYEGPASRAAARANDHYLRTMQVPGGLQSYGTVVQLMMALDAKGELF